jgi:hypothetical protein
MAVAGLAVAAQQDLVGGVEEEKMGTIPVGLELVERRARLREQRAAPRVDDERDTGVTALATHFERRFHQARRQVVERVVVEILEDLDGL